MSFHYFSIIILTRYCSFCPFGVLLPTSEKEVGEPLPSLSMNELIRASDRAGVNMAALRPQ